MKINDAQKSKLILPPDTPKPKRAGGKHFEEILKSNLKLSNVAVEIKNSSTKNAVPSIQKTNSIIPLSIDREELVGRIIKFLDIMDDYANRLGNPNITLKEISPLILEIEEENSQLKFLAESLPPFDDIRSLLEEVLIRSSVEIIKYNRGDYISR